MNAENASIIALAYFHRHESVTKTSLSWLALSLKCFLLCSELTQAVEFLAHVEEINAAAPIAATRQLLVFFVPFRMTLSWFMSFAF